MGVVVRRAAIPIAEFVAAKGVRVPVRGSRRLLGWPSCGREALFLRRVLVRPPMAVPVPQLCGILRIGVPTGWCECGSAHDPPENLGRWPSGLSRGRESTHDYWVALGHSLGAGDVTPTVPKVLRPSGARRRAEVRIEGQQVRKRRGRPLGQLVEPDRLAA